MEQIGGVDRDKAYMDNIRPMPAWTAETCVGRLVTEKAPKKTVSKKTPKRKS